MGSELPHLPGGTDVVLYPASVKASTDLQDSLAAAGFKVTRINTYNTVSLQASGLVGVHEIQLQRSGRVFLGGSGGFVSSVELFPNLQREWCVRDDLEEEVDINMPQARKPGHCVALCDAVPCPQVYLCL